MKQLKGLTEEMKTGIIGILESQNANSIGELRKIDKICSKIESSDENVLLLEDEEFLFLANKISQFDKWNPAKKFRKITLDLSDIIDLAKKEVM
jgi:hypothetical protein